MVSTNLAAFFFPGGPYRKREKLLMGWVMCSGAKNCDGRMFNYGP